MFSALCLIYTHLNTFLNGYEYASVPRKITNYLHLHVLLYVPLQYHSLVYAYLFLQLSASSSVGDRVVGAELKDLMKILSVKNESFLFGGFDTTTIKFP